MIVPARHGGSIWTKEKALPLPKGMTASTVPVSPGWQPAHETGCILPL
jgi:hypothetical protein